ncbi:transposase [Streptomyces sp. NPDC002547]
MVGLVKCGTHAVFDAALAALRTGEQALARAVLVSLRPGMLLLAHRGFCGVDLWRTAAATGADLLWRVRKDLVLQFAEDLSDRAAADAVGTRIGSTRWCLELDDPGFDYSVLCKFRARLAENGAADQLLEAMLQRVTEASNCASGTATPCRRLICGSAHPTTPRRITASNGALPGAATEST